jgi:hypothetical protein
MKNTLPNSARLLIGLVAATSVGTLALSAMNDQLDLSLRFLILAVGAVAASRFKIKLPGMSTTMSGNLPILLLAISQLGLLEASLLAVACALTQSYASGNKKPSLVQLVFNTGALANATGAATWAFYFGLRHGGNAGQVLAFTLAAAAYFVANTLPVAVIIALSEAKNAVHTWRTVFLWTFPNYVMAAGLATMAALAGPALSWKVMTPMMLVLFGVYRCYSLYAEAHKQEQPLLAMAAVSSR